MTVNQREKLVELLYWLIKVNMIIKPIQPVHSIDFYCQADQLNIMKLTMKRFCFKRENEKGSFKEGTQQFWFGSLFLHKSTLILKKVCPHINFAKWWWFAFHCLLLPSWALLSEQLIIKKLTMSRFCFKMENKRENSPIWIRFTFPAYIHTYFEKCLSIY